MDVVRECSWTSIHVALLIVAATAAGLHYYTNLITASSKSSTITVGLRNCLILVDCENLIYHRQFRTPCLCSSQSSTITVRLRKRLILVGCENRIYHH